MPVRKLIPAIVAFIAFAIFGGGQNVMSQLIYSNDFEDDPVGIYSASNLDADWNSSPFSNGVDEGRVSIVSDASGKYLEALYPEGFMAVVTMIPVPNGSWSSGKPMKRLNLSIVLSLEPDLMLFAVESCPA